MKEGKYRLVVNNYCRRSSGAGFEVEVEIEGTLYSYVHSGPLRTSQNIEVATITYSKVDGFTVSGLMTGKKASKQVWNVTTETFVPVSMIMNSPNHWDGEQTGNKHWFFMMQDCVNPEPARGFFNEFINPNLDKHRKVLEVLGNKMKTEESDKQLSGIGFSSTIRNQAVVKVTGKFTRTLKINF